MDFSASMDIAASGMQAQTQRIKIIAQNLANADSTATQPGQDPYRRQIISFKSVYDKVAGANVVKVAQVSTDNSAFPSKYDPANSAADANGYVSLPNVKPELEAADMREAQASYEANLSAMDLVKNMMLQTVNAIKA